MIPRGFRRPRALLFIPDLSAARPRGSLRSFACAAEAAAQIDEWMLDSDPAGSPADAPTGRDASSARGAPRPELIPRRRLVLSSRMRA